jgi:hypothetical protein
LKTFFPETNHLNFASIFSDETSSDDYVDEGFEGSAVPIDISHDEL